MRRINLRVFGLLHIGQPHLAFRARAHRHLYYRDPQVPPMNPDPIIQKCWSCIMGMIISHLFPPKFGKNPPEYRIIKLDVHN